MGNFTDDMFCSQDADADKMFGVSAPKDGAPDTRYVQVHGTENTGKISAFAAFQPGIARVFEVLFEQDDATPEFYLSAVSLFTLISIRAISMTACFVFRLLSCYRRLYVQTGSPPAGLTSTRRPGASPPTSTTSYTRT